jgi:hypothetical protein
MKRSVTRHSSVATLASGEVTPKKGKRGDDANWTDANLTVLKREKINAAIQLLQIYGENLKQR